MPRLSAAAVIVSIVAGLIACTPVASPTRLAPSGGASAAPSEAVSPGAPSVLTVYAAASLKNVLDKAKTAFEAANRHTTLTIATDSSAALETQIEQGAPADVFLSADTTNPKKLVDKGLTAGAEVTFAGNKLIVIVPSAGAPCSIWVSSAADESVAIVNVVRRLAASKAVFALSNTFLSDAAA